MKHQHWCAVPSKNSSNVPLMLGFVGWAGFICPPCGLFRLLTPAAMPSPMLGLMKPGQRAAKVTVLKLLQSYGWKDVLDLGDILSSGAMELMMPIWLRVWGKLGQTTVFNYKIVR